MPVGFVFDVEGLGRLRRAPQTVARTLDVRPGDGRERRIRTTDDWKVRGYQIESRVLDDLGAPTGARLRSPAMVVARDPLSGEMKPVRAVLTVVGWEDVVVYGDEPLGRYRALDATDAKLSGHVTVDGLRAAWAREHPSAALARLYHFMLGDRRDKTVWLTSVRSMVAGRVGDYTHSPAKSCDPDAPLLNDGVVESLTMHARQKDAARRARIAAEYATGSLAERVARVAR